MRHRRRAPTRFCSLVRDTADRRGGGGDRLVERSKVSLQTIVVTLPTTGHRRVIHGLRSCPEARI